MITLRAFVPAAVAAAFAVAGCGSSSSSSSNSSTAASQSRTTADYISDEYCQRLGSGEWVTNDATESPCVPDPGLATGDEKADGAGPIPRCFSCKLADWKRAERTQRKQIEANRAGSTTASTTKTIHTNATHTASAPRPRAPKPAAPQRHCITAGGYKGLYSTASAFRSDNDMAAPPVPTDGIAWYTILSTEHGCVTSYSADIFASPPWGAPDVMFLTEGISLPEDKNDVHDGDRCTVYTSATLTKASGYKYAVVTGEAQEGHGAPAHAEIHLTNDGSCPSP